MARLAVDIALGLRAFAVDVALTTDDATLALVGPSGAGKTTILRAVAGLATPDRGRIALDDSVWFGDGIDVAPERRSVGLVPQDYALFPHMTVRENVAFGGEVAGLLERMGIEDLADARPDALSGGERQRVALARALARRPAVLLLDEPLAALDAQTRASVRAQLQALLADVALPTLLVTHDFRDAAALADRVAVIVEGRVRQQGTPAELVAAPVDAFVVAFTGGCVLRGVGGGDHVVLDDGQRVPVAADGPVALGLYPWELRAETAAPACGVQCVVDALVDIGGRVEIHAGGLVASVEAAPVRRGERVWLAFDPAAARVLRG